MYKPCVIDIELLHMHLCHMLFIISLLFVAPVAAFVAVIVCCGVVINIVVDSYA